MKRTAQEGNVAADGFSAGKSADGLVYNRLKDGGRQVRLGCALVDERLDIRLCEHTASCGDGVDGIVGLCVLV